MHLCTISALNMSQIYIPPDNQMFIFFYAVFLLQIAPLLVSQNSFCSANLVVKFQQVKFRRRLSTNKGTAINIATRIILVCNIYYDKDGFWSAGYTAISLEFSDFVEKTHGQCFFLHLGHGLRC